MQIILTKVDSLEGIDEFKICTDYKFEGVSSGFRKDAGYLRKVVPVYYTYKGYKSIRGETDFSRLPESLVGSISDFENFIGSRVALVSTGPEMKETIIR